MEITVMCDQKNCKFNMGNKVHHDHPNDKCEHPFPRIYQHPKSECKSFERLPNVRNCIHYAEDRNGCMSNLKQGLWCTGPDCGLYLKRI